MVSNRIQSLGGKTHIVESSMAKEIGVNGNLKVSTLKAMFKEQFGVNIRVYHGVKFASDDATLASIRVDDEGEERRKDFSVHGNSKVGTVEQDFRKNVGVKIQIEDATGELADNGVSVGSLRRN
jgi:hypothetical protein